jgi:hypothetical protein
LFFIDMDTCSPICHSVRDPPCDTPPPSCDIMRLLLKHPVPPRASHILWMAPYLQYTQGFIGRDATTWKI